MKWAVQQEDAENFAMFTTCSMALPGNERLCCRVDGFLPFSNSDAYNPTSN